MFTAPSLAPKGREYPGLAQGVPTFYGDDEYENGFPFVQFTVDSTLLGHAAVRFRGRELTRMSYAGAMHFRIQVYRVENDSSLVFERRSTRFEVVTRPHRASEFRPRR